MKNIWKTWCAGCDVIYWHMNNSFRSNWSKWVDIEYVIQRDKLMLDKYYHLNLLQVSVNSKTGKRKYSFTNIMSSYDTEFLSQIAKQLRPFLNCRQK